MTDSRNPTEMLKEAQRELIWQTVNFCASRMKAGRGYVGGHSQNLAIAAEMQRHLGLD